MLGEDSVVGEQQQALGVGVESSHVEESLGALGDVVAHARAAEVIGHRGDDASGLVQCDNDSVGGGRDPLAVDAHHGAAWIHAHALFAHHAPVDLDSTQGNHLLAGTTTADPRCREDLLESHSLVSHYSPAATASMTASSSARSGRCSARSVRSSSDAIPMRSRK